jgi:hypothetical protein
MMTSQNLLIIFVILAFTVIYLLHIRLFQFFGGEALRNRISKAHMAVGHMLIGLQFVITTSLLSLITILFYYRWLSHAKFNDSIRYRTELSINCLILIFALGGLLLIFEVGKYSRIFAAYILTVTILGAFFANQTKYNIQNGISSTESIICAVGMSYLFWLYACGIFFYLYMKIKEKYVLGAN